MSTPVIGKYYLLSIGGWNFTTFAVFCVALGIFGAGFLCGIFTRWWG